ncbi:hypothetical protein F2P79_025847 [Pimephales promelas]|nr:hypothetical protein F2P79_025847 [Pimephales promelas]
METVIFFCVFSCWIMRITSSDLSLGGSSVVRVRMGENITLNCSMRDRYEVAWYLLRSDELVLLSSAEKDKSGRKLLTNYNLNSNHVKMTADNWVTGVSLTITGVTESDSGLYFCGVKSDAPEMFFDKPIRLDIEGLFIIEDVRTEVEITDEVTVTERVLMFAGVGLAVFVFFLATILAGGIIYHRGQQKGWKAAKHLSAGGSSVLRVRMGENITLNCSMRNRYEVAWYLLRSEELVLLSSAEKDKNERKLLINYNLNSNRVKITADSWVTRVSLTITGVTESDSGLYFCGVKSDAPEMHFDKPIRLDIEGIFVTEEPKEEDGVPDEVTVTEPVLMFVGVGLAVFVFFLATVVAGRVIYHRGQQKGWKAAKQEAMNQKAA